MHTTLLTNICYTRSKLYSFINAFLIILRVSTDSLAKLWFILAYVLNNGCGHWTLVKHFVEFMFNSCSSYEYSYIIEGIRDITP